VIRDWDEFAAAVFDVVPAPLALLLLVVLAAAVAALWYWFPAWVPRRLPRWRRRARKAKPAKVVKDAKEDETQELPEPDPEPTVRLPGGMLLADRLAAEGRYAEAIRQRLRDVVGDLTAAGVVRPLPGTTAAEVAALVAVERPVVAASMGSATELFSEVWYGNRTADQDRDDRMRSLTGQVREQTMPHQVREQTMPHGTPTGGGR
jgi:hypothetical protein